MKLFKLFWFLIPTLFLAAAEDGGGGDNDPPAPPPAPPALLPPDLDAGIKALIEKHNNDMRSVIDKLYSENYSYREKIRDLKDQVKEAQTQTPGRNQAVISKDDAELLEQYKALGDIETLKKQQGELTTATEELGALRKRDTLREVAEAAGFKLPVLERLGADLEFEIKEVEKDGEKTKIAHVKNGDEITPLSDYAQANWADFLPSLKAEPQGQQQPPVTFPSQSPGKSTAPQSGVLEKFIKNAQEVRNAQPNPLVPQQ